VMKRKYADINKKHHLGSVIWVRTIVFISYASIAIFFLKLTYTLAGFELGYFFLRWARCHCAASPPEQGCQIFLDTIYPNGGKYTKLQLNHQMVIKNIKWP
jgi:hypothetical protein